MPKIITDIPAEHDVLKKYLDEIGAPKANDIGMIYSAKGRVKAHIAALEAENKELREAVNKLTKFHVPGCPAILGRPCTCGRVEYRALLKNGGKK